MSYGAQQYMQTQAQRDKEYPSIYTNGIMPSRAAQVMEQGWKEVGVQPGKCPPGGPKRVAGKVDLTQDRLALKAITEGDAVSIMRNMNKLRKQFDESYLNEELEGEKAGGASTRAGNSPLKGRPKGKGAKPTKDLGDEMELEKTEESEQYAAFRN